MRVLIVNKYYYLRGGDCTAVFGMEQLLRAKGHEVAVFSMQNPLNVSSRWDMYFPREVVFSFSGFTGILPAVWRIFHSPEVARKFGQLLDDFRPDIVHLHNIHSYLSPLVAQIAHQKGIRVVWTLHDYKLICPTYSCLRHGVVCETCFKNKFDVVRYKCMKNSYIASLLGYLEGRYWHSRKLSRLTNLFISPSMFLKTKMTEAGFPSGQIKVLHNFVPLPLTPSFDKEDYYCYVGRLSEEKGVNTLLEAAAQLPYPLKVIGGGALLDAYQKKYACRHIDFLGYLAQTELYPIVRKARFIVLPSLWYENNPYSIIEALCMGTPVLGAQIGGIPELIQEGVNGFLFRSGDIPDLTAKINSCFSFFVDAKIFQQIYADAQNKFGPETFYTKLMNVYES